MSTLTNPADRLHEVLMHHAQVFRGHSLGYQTLALKEVDTEQRARAETAADIYEICATALELSAKAEVEPDPRPAKRIKNPAALAAVHLRDVSCLLCGTRPVSVHHLLSRSLGGDDVDENLVALCGNGVTGCHGFVERHDPDVCRLLRVSLAPEQIDYLVRKKSWDWLNSRYPETVA